MVGEMTLSMSENYIVLSYYCTILTELLMSHMGDNRTNNEWMKLKPKPNSMPNVCGKCSTKK